MLAKEHGLYREIEINNKTWYGATTLKFIEGDGMTWKEMKEINTVLMLNGFLPWEWGLYGVGGGLRNNIKRDNGSFKCALCSVGFEKSGRVKFAPDSPGKSTLPGPFKLLRTPEALAKGETIVFYNEEGEDVRRVYYNGLAEQFFGDVMFEDNIDCKNRIREQLKTMPRRLVNDIPASKAILDRRLELLKLHAPDHVNMFN